MGIILNQRKCMIINFTIVHIPLSATNIVNQLIKNLVHKFVHDMLDFNMISGVFLLSFKSENIHGETKEGQ